MTDEKTNQVLELSRFILDYQCAVLVGNKMHPKKYLRMFEDEKLCVVIEDWLEDHSLVVVEKERLKC